MSEYACRLRLIVAQTQVDFKAEEYVDSAYITYIQDRVLRQLYKKLKQEQEMTNSDPDWLPCGHNLMWKQKLADEQVE